MSGTSRHLPEALVPDMVARIFPNGLAITRAITTHAGCLVCR